MSNKESKPTKIERTGDKEFIVRHDDGSIFECNSTHKESLDRVPGCKPKLFFSGGFGEKKPLVCNKCNKVVHKVTFKDNSYFCRDCL